MDEGHPRDMLIDATSLVFTDTSLPPGLAFEVGDFDDPEWQAAAARVLELVAGMSGGPLSSAAAWEDMTVWLQDGAELVVFLRRSLQTIDAAAHLLHALAAPVADGDLPELLRQLEPAG